MKQEKRYEQLKALLDAVKDEQDLISIETGYKEDAEVGCALEHATLQFCGFCIKIYPDGLWSWEDTRAKK